jgi:hypothetical protein
MYTGHLSQVEGIATTFYRRHHELVNGYELAISYTAMDLFLFLVDICLPSITDKTINRI